MLSDLLIISLFNKVTFSSGCFKPSRYNAGKKCSAVGCASYPSCVDKMVKSASGTLSLCKQRSTVSLKDNAQE